MCDDGNISAKLYRLKGIGGLVDGVLADAEKLAKCPNYWLPRSSLEDPEQRSSTRMHVDVLIELLYRDCMQDQVASDFAGAEWWVQTYEAGRGLAFHFDKDEYAMAEKQEMHHPQHSSVVYLTGAVDARQAPTVVLQQRFDAASRRPVPADPPACVLSFPRSANFLVFDGELGHGVLDAVTPGKRATLLVNWWRHRPQAINTISLADLETRGLRVLGPDAHRLANSCVSTLPPPPVLNVAETGSTVQQVDDLLDKHGVCVLGEQAVDWVCIHHRGLSLYPIADQLAGSAAACAAAFVPTAMLAGSASDAGSDD